MNGYNPIRKENYSYAVNFFKADWFFPEVDKVGWINLDIYFTYLSLTSLTELSVNRNKKNPEKLKISRLSLKVTIHHLLMIM